MSTSSSTGPVALPSITLKSGETITIGSDTVTLVNAVVESIAENPHNPEAYPAGSGVVVSVEINGRTAELSLLSEGYESKSLVWSDGVRVEFVEYRDRDGTAILQLQRVSEAVVGTLRSVRVVKAGSADLDDGLRLRFDGHSHKMMDEGSGGSPLLVAVSYLRGDAVLLRDGYSLGPPAKGSQWTWRDYRFTLRDYAYDEFMLLDVQRLSLVPVRAP